MRVIGIAVFVLLIFLLPIPLAELSFLSPLELILLVL